MIVMVGVERVIGLSVGSGGCAECGSTTKCGPCYIPGMFRYLLICLMLFSGSAHAAEDDFDAVKKAVQDAAFDKYIEQIDDRPGLAHDTNLAIAPDPAPGFDRRKGERPWDIESGIN